MECEKCEYYDREGDRCAAFCCDPFSCDDPLPCERDGVDIDGDMP